MKSIMPFLLAFALGATLVDGQDPADADRALRERIAALTELLERHAARSRGDEEARLVLETYDVSDLCSPVRDGFFEPTNLRPSGYQAPESAEAEPRATYEVDVIIELIRTLVYPESWDTVDGADIQPKQARLFVTQIPAVQARIASLLDRLRALLDAQVAVEVVAVPVDAAVAAVLARRPRELAPEEAQALLAGPRLGSARLVCFDGQQVALRSGEQRSFLADYEVEIAEASSIAYPVLGKLFDGCSVQVRATLDRGANGVVLHCLLERTQLDEPVRRLQLGHGPLELPSMRLTRLWTSLYAPLGATVVAGAGTAGGEPCALLVTARRVSSRATK